MPAAETSLLLPFLLIFALHECEEIFTFRRWMQRNGTDLSRRFPFSRRFVRHTGNLSTAGFALIAAEEFFLRVGATWIANQWDNISSMGLPFSGFCPPSCRAYRPMSDHRSIHTRNRVDAARRTVLHFRHNPDNRHLRHRDDSLVHLSGIVFAGINLVLLHKWVAKYTAARIDRPNPDQ